MQFVSFQDLIRRYYSGESFVIFDTETTGLNTYHDEIVEIAGAIWELREEPQIFHELLRVNPHRISPGAQAVHQIPLAEIQAARPAPEVLRDFVEFCGRRTLIAHNAKFDFDMLNYNLIRHGFTPYPADQVVCTYRYSQEQKLPGKLENLATHYKVDLQTIRLHRASGDVAVLTQILNTMMKQYEPKEMQYSLIL